MHVNKNTIKDAITKLQAEEELHLCHTHNRPPIIITGGEQASIIDEGNDLYIIGRGLWIDCTTICIMKKHELGYGL